MAKQKVKVTLASLIIAGAAWGLFATFCPRPPRPDAALHGALGQAVGREAAQLLGAGGRIVLIARDTETFPNPAADVQIKSFVEALRRSEARVAATNLVKLDPLRVVAVPPGDFFQILKRGSEADVVVSFLGPPALNEEQVAKLGDKIPKVIAVCTGELPRQVDLKTLFAQKLLQAAVISRQAAASAWAGGPPTKFEDLFAMIRPADLSELPSAGANRR